MSQVAPRLCLLLVALVPSSQVRNVQNLFKGTTDLFLLPSHQSQTCSPPSGYTYRMGIYYKYLSGPNNFDTASTICSYDGATLAMPRNQCHLRVVKTYGTTLVTC